METTSVITPEAPQAPGKKGRLPSFRLPKGKKGKKWLRRGLIAAGALLGVYWFVVRPGQSGGLPALGQYTPEAAQHRDLTVGVLGTGTVTPIDSYYLDRKSVV